jgi:nitrogen fixation protein NifU and related proteins
MSNTLYGELIAEHWKHPRNQGTLAAPDVSREELNPLCGDRLRLELQIEQGTITQARFRGDACMVATASASLLTSRLHGMKLDEARAFSKEDVLALLGGPLRPARVACALLVHTALSQGLAGYGGGR